VLVCLPSTAVVRRMTDWEGLLCLGGKEQENGAGLREEENAGTGWRGREAEGKWRRKKKWWAIDEKERLLEAGVFFGRLRGRRKTKGKSWTRGERTVGAVVGSPSSRVFSSPVSFYRQGKPCGDNGIRDKP